MSIVYSPSIPNFADELFKVLGKAEDFCAQPEDVEDGTVTYGYGYTFVRKGTNGTWARFVPMSEDLATPEGVSQSQRLYLAPT